MTTGPDILLERVRVATADEYEIDREIGRGGMAAVFLARDIALQRRVAIKVMLPDLLAVQGVSERFIIEARTAAHLDHPGIVTVYSVKQRNGLLFIVMKYVEGHTLEAVLRAQGRLDPIAVALIGSRVAEALDFAHGEGVVHRDVKPSNIMIDMRGRPVVTDFGIARVMTAQSITVAGSMLGTPTHMSPEQCKGLPATAASDQYSLGVTLYEMLSGRVPFAGSLFELINAHREQAPPPMRELVPGIDSALEHTVMRMLAKEPSQRWSSMTEVVQRLAAHTTVQHGDESLRATLSLSGTYNATPDRGVGAVDLLTPPGRIPTSATPSGGSSLSPLPFPSPASPVPAPPAEPASQHRAAAIIVERQSHPAMPAESRSRGSRRAPGIIAGLVVVAAIGAFAAWRARSADQPGTAPAAATAQIPATTPTNPPADSVARESRARESLARDSLARDSAARDSTARMVAARDSARADSIARRDSAAKAALARPAGPRVPSESRAVSPRTPGVRPESIAVQCARLLERASLGERLTEAERTMLQRRCPR